MSENLMNKIREQVQSFVTIQLSRITADTLGWLAAILIHFSTIPTLLALLKGVTDRTPGLDIVLFLWTGLSSIPRGKLQKMNGRWVRVKGVFWGGTKAPEEQSFPSVYISFCELSKGVIDARIV